MNEPVYPTRFTPGPWVKINGCDVFTNLGAANAEGIQAPSTDGWMIADADMGSLSTDEVLANARLKAKADKIMSDIREDFEEAAARMGYSLRMRDSTSEDGDYGDRETQGAWDMWQEAHDLYAQPQSAVPAPVGWIKWPETMPAPCQCVDLWGSIVGGHQHGDESRVENCFYDGARRAWWRWDSSCLLRRYIESMNITHWMEVPAGPVE